MKKILIFLCILFLSFIISGCHDSLKDVIDPSRKHEYVGFIERYEEKNGEIYLYVDKNTEYLGIYGLIKRNYLIAKDNGFDMDKKENLFFTTVTIAVSNVYVVEIKSENDIYLPYDEGLENLKTYLMRYIV